MSVEPVPISNNNMYIRDITAGSSHVLCLSGSDKVHSFSMCFGSTEHLVMLWNQPDGFYEPSALSS